MASFDFPLSKVIEAEDLTVKLQSFELPDWKGRVRFAAQIKFLQRPVEKSEIYQLPII